MSENTTPRAPVAATAASLARSLDRATYEGYRAGFTAARDAAAALAGQEGHQALAAAIAALEPLPDHSRDDLGRG